MKLKIWEEIRDEGQTDGGESLDKFSKFEFVENRCLASCIKTFNHTSKIGYVSESWGEKENALYPTSTDGLASCPVWRRVSQKHFPWLNLTLVGRRSKDFWFTLLSSHQRETQESNAFAECRHTNVINDTKHRAGKQVTGSSRTEMSVGKLVPKVKPSIKGLREKVRGGGGEEAPIFLHITSSEQVGMWVVVVGLPRWFVQLSE